VTSEINSAISDHTDWLRGPRLADLISQSYRLLTRRLRSDPPTEEATMQGSVSDIGVQRSRSARPLGVSILALLKQHTDVGGGYTNVSPIPFDDAPNIQGDRRGEVQAGGRRTIPRRRFMSGMRDLRE